MICSVEGCNKKTVAKGWCCAHYARNYRSKCHPNINYGAYADRPRSHQDHSQRTRHYMMGKWVAFKEDQVRDIEAHAKARGWFFTQAVRDLVDRGLRCPNT